MSFDVVKDVLEALSYVSTMVGIPVAILVFLYEKRKDRLAQEIDTYLRANDRYIEYLSLCLDKPELECFEFSALDPEVKAAGLSVEKLTLFTILISILEAAFLLYRRHRSYIRRAQWRGWSEYMKSWSERADFRQAWPILGPQFDSDFFIMMDEFVRGATGPLPPGTLSKR